MVSDMILSKLMFCLFFLCFGLSYASQRQFLHTQFKLALATGSTVKEGGACKVNRNLEPTAPYCAGGVYTCVVDSIPASSSYSQGYTGTLSGHCNSSFLLGSYCLSESIPFKIGTKHIITSTCVSCTCTYNPLFPYANKATCNCEKQPPCYVGFNGNPAGGACPQPQTECLVSSVGVKKSINGYPIDKGSCTFPDFSNQPVCVSLGQGWGPKFYQNGTKKVPYPTDRCTSCTCVNGQFVNCKKITPCLRK